jgi:hypothetical protein
MIKVINSSSYDNNDDDDDNNNSIQFISIGLLKLGNSEWPTRGQH